VERNLTFLGLQGMIDPARPEVKVAVASLSRGPAQHHDHGATIATTAQAIAGQIGMLTEGGEVVTGARSTR